jgi:hypothetical protein
MKIPTESKPNDGQDETVFVIDETEPKTPWWRNRKILTLAVVVAVGVVAGAVVGYKVQTAENDTPPFELEAVHAAESTTKKAPKTA